MVAFIIEQAVLGSVHTPTLNVDARSASAVAVMHVLSHPGTLLS
jgi:hypothetical protein